MIANVLRSFRNYKAKYTPNSSHHKKIIEPQNLIRRVPEGLDKKLIVFLGTFE